MTQDKAGEALLILGYATHHEFEPLLFPSRAEAILYCEDDEQPIPLTDLDAATAALEALQQRNAKLERQLADMRLIIGRPIGTRRIADLIRRTEAVEAALQAERERVKGLEKLITQVRTDAAAQDVLFEWLGPIDYAMKKENTK